MIISVDHGNKSIKTPNALFTSGLISSEGLQGFKTDYTNSGGRGEECFMKWRYAPGCCGKRQHQQHCAQQNDPCKAQYDNLKRRKAALSAKYFFRHRPHSL